MEGRLNHKVYLTLLFILIVAALTAKQTQAEYGGGSGTAEDPYLIYTAAQMNAIGANSLDWDKHFKLMADIDLGEFTGNSFNIISTFTGGFDGNDHRISNFTYEGGHGLFNYVIGKNAYIKNLVLVNPEVNAVLLNRVGLLAGKIEDGKVINCRVEQGIVTGEQSVGGLVGMCWRGIITNCHSIATVSGSGINPNNEFMFGGLVGFNYEGTVTDCSSAGSVSGGYMYFGGLVGDNMGGEVLNCRSQANVTGGDWVGGLVGCNDCLTITNPGLISYCTASGDVVGNELIGGLAGLNWCAISDCYATGNVSGSSDVGGLVGDNITASIDSEGQTDAIISNCYSVGQVSGTNYVGGLVGRHRAAGPKQPITINSFWDIETSSQTSSAGGTGKTTVQMQTKSTFTSAGWDFITPVWTIAEEDYPRLWWEENILYVPGHYPTIQAAIDAAANGDTVLVAAGIYYENITLKDGVQVRGAGADVTTINGGGVEPVVTAVEVGSGTVLDGFTITNGNVGNGRGIRLNGGSPVITNNVVTQNSGGGFYAHFSSATIAHNTISDNSAANGGGIYVDNWPSNTGPMPNIEYNNIYGNNTSGAAAGGGGGIYLQFSSPTVRGNTIAANSADAGGGIAANHSFSIIANNIIISNSAGKYGGGGLWVVNNSSPFIVNNTVVNNTASGPGTGIGSSGSQTFPFDITNCIVWGNDLYNCTATYSDIEGGYPGEGNINADPRFVDIAGGNLHLLPDSPCINAGNPNYVPGPYETDIDGDPRVIGLRIDMGADEVDTELLVPTEYETIQAAIDASYNGNIVIVAPRIYTGPGNRDIDFKGKAITVRSTNPNDPNVVAATIIDCNGSEAEPHSGFIFQNGEDANSTLEGFTITNGYANAGGAIYCIASSPAVKNCIFSKNVSKWDGGGIYDYNSSPEVTNCTFTGNSAGQYGGGMFNRYSSPTLNNCIFNNNSAAFISGGGIYNYYSSLEVTNCTFTENSAYSDPAYPSVSFGGGICNRYGSSTIANCTFTGNSAGRGGGMYNYGNSLTITNCTFTDNQAAIGGGVSNGSNSSSTVTNCIFIGNSVTDTGGGMSSYLDSNSIVNNCTFTDNSSDGWGGGMCIEHGSYMVNNCTFNGNSAGYDGGGLDDTNCVTVVQNCLFIRNSAGQFGGGMYTYLNSNSIVKNCTFSGNSASDWGGAMMVDESTATATNSIFWDNPASEEIYVYSGTVTVSYSDVKGGWAGTGNIDADPRFVNPDINDFHLLPNSPCINTGDPNFIPEPNETDIDGEPRVMLARVDMGADEFNPFEVNFVIVNKRRIGRTIFEYDCNITLTNISLFTVSSVQLEIVEASENMVLIDPNVTFGDIEIGPGESAISLDMCSFQVDRSEPAEIMWQSDYEIVDGVLEVQDIASGACFLNLAIIGGDIDGDNRVDLDDLDILVDQWLQPPGSPSADIVPPPDGDNIVNFLDFALLAKNWLKGIGE